MIVSFLSPHYCVCIIWLLFYVLLTANNTQNNNHIEISHKHVLNTNLQWKYFDCNVEISLNEWESVYITNDLLNNATEFTLYSDKGSTPVILKNCGIVQFSNGLPDVYNWSLVISGIGNQITIMTQRIGSNAKESGYHPVFTRVYYR